MDLTSNEHIFCNYFNLVVVQKVVILSEVYENSRQDGTQTQADDSL